MVRVQGLAILTSIHTCNDIEVIRNACICIPTFLLENLLEMCEQASRNDTPHASTIETQDTNLASKVPRVITRLQPLQLLSS